MTRFRRVAHRVVTAIVAAFNRNPWTGQVLELVPRNVGEAYNHDGLRTTHDHSFIDTLEFRRAYQRAVQAAGWDYGIHWRVHVVLWAARAVQTVPGAFVECGTGRGFMASAICEHMVWESRHFYLFDTFQPELVTPDSTERHQIRSSVYANGYEEVEANFREWTGVTLVVGNIPDSLANVEINSVAFLHIDMNNPVPEEAAVRHFWPKLSPGAIIVFDDYAYRGYRASHVSADRVAADLGFSILSLPTGQGLAIKPVL